MIYKTSNGHAINIHERNLEILLIDADNSDYTVMFYNNYKNDSMPVESFKTEKECQDLINYIIDGFVNNRRYCSYVDFMRNMT